MKKIETFDELCSLKIGTFVHIKTRKSVNYIVAVCPLSVLPSQSIAEDNTNYLMIPKLPAGAMVTVPGLIIKVCFYAHAPGKSYLCHSVTRVDFEDDVWPYEFYVLEPIEVCTLFLQMHEMAQGADDVVKVLESNLAKMRKFIS